MQRVLIWDGEGPEDLLIVTSGNATPDDLQAVADAITGDARFRTGMTILIDHSKTSFEGMPLAEVRRRAEALRSDSARLGPQRIAFVMRNVVDFGIMRQLQGLTDGDLPYEPAVFVEIEQARTWLRGPGTTQ